MLQSTVLNLVTTFHFSSLPFFFFYFVWPFSIITADCDLILNWRGMSRLTVLKVSPFGSKEDLSLALDTGDAGG